MERKTRTSGHEGTGVGGMSVIGMNAVLQIYDRHDHLINVSITGSKPIAKGTFGTVFKASFQTIDDSQNGCPQQIVAIKRIIQDDRYKNREIEIMKFIDHPNITKLKGYSNIDIVKMDKERKYNSSASFKFNYLAHGENEQRDPHKSCLSIIMEFIPTNLHQVIQMQTETPNKALSTTKIMIYLYQIFRGLAYLHSFNICHRDIKPTNIMVDANSSVVKICDFGSAKILTRNEPNVSYICSRYYRAPELIIESTCYTTMIDVWSTGCILGEMITGKPLFSTGEGIKQLDEIAKVLGTPSDDTVISMNPSFFKHHRSLKSMGHKKVLIHTSFRKILKDKWFINLITDTLVYDPTKRLSAIESMCHPTFDYLRNNYDPNLGGIVTPTTGVILPHDEPITKCPNIFEFTALEKEAPRNYFQLLTPKYLMAENDNINPLVSPSNRPDGLDTSTRSPNSRNQLHRLLMRASSSHLGFNLHSNSTIASPSSGHRVSRSSRTLSRYASTDMLSVTLTEGDWFNRHKTSKSSNKEFDEKRRKINKEK